MCSLCNKDSMEGLRSFSIEELLEQEEKAIFIVDLQALPPTPIYFNPYLRSIELLEQNIIDLWNQADPSYILGEVVIPSPTLQWCAESAGEVDGVANSLTFRGVEWVTYTIGKRYRVITGDFIIPAQDVVTFATSKSESLKTSTISSLQESNAELPALPPPYIPGFSISEEVIDAPSHSQFLKLFQEHDWKSTKLGPIEHWSPALQHACEYLIADPQPSALLWGKDYLFLYNEAYIVFLGESKHPNVLGKPVDEAWLETADYLIPLYNQVASDRRGMTIGDTAFDIDRNGFLEEVYVTFSMIPMLGDDGTIAIYNACHETTRRVYAEQRLTTLLNLAHPVSHVFGLERYWGHLVKGLSACTGDLPLTLVYQTTTDLSRGGSSAFSSTISSPSLPSENSSFNVFDSTPGVTDWKLAGAVNEAHDFPQYLSEDDAKELFSLFHKMLLKKDPSHLQITDGTLSEKLLSKFKSSGKGKDCVSAAFIPLRATGMQLVVGFMIVGINPKRPYDIEYFQFLQLLQRQCSPNLASAITCDIETRRARVIAERSTKKVQYLNESLEDNLYETERINKRFERFQRLTEMSTVGMFDFNLEGKLIQANDAWFGMSGHAKLPNGTPSERFSFMGYVYPPDVQLVQLMWNQLTQGHSVNFEMRWKRSATNMTAGIPEYDYVWILAACVPVADELGDIVSITGCTTDISSQKSEALQRQKTEEVLELKRQQENFIDMTSHELRNPLSAVVQCSESIVEIFTELAAINEMLRSVDPGLNKSMTRLIDSGHDAIHTVLSCSDHQSRIIEDTLTLSKLDSKLLTISPVISSPRKLLKDLHKMFAVEAERAKVNFEVIEDNSLQNLAVKWLMMDPSRTLQILINLVTNAIKFTKGEARNLKLVSVTMSVSTERPSGNCGFPDSGVVYNSSQFLREDITMEPEWGGGEPIYLCFTVKDTGRGVNPDEQARLFSRFSQASKKTHIVYGGAGLGLFISQELTELQGGEIGMTSNTREGSKFSFYIKSRRGEAEHATKLPMLPSPIADSRPKLAELGPISVLVVEDNITNQTILCKQLTKIGCEAVGVGDGKQALDWIKRTKHWEGKEPLSIILMDVEMPVMDGLTCTRKIRELESLGEMNGHIPIIGTSANARSEQVADILEAGMDTSVSKPFRISELVPKMVTVLKRGYFAT